MTGVSVDGRKLAESDYAISSTGTGATLTLDAGHLAGLATGSHRLEVSLDDACALETTFTVEDAQVAPTQTDDGSGANHPVSYHVYHDDGFYRSGGDHGSDTSVADTIPVRRLFGADRYQTMAAVVADAFDTSGACVAASGTSLADALSAAGLAGALRAPVVLTTPETLSAEAQAQISRLDAKRVYLMGGEAALSPAVEAAVSSLGVEVTRVAGDVRQATSVEAMRLARKEGSAADTVLVASGTGFADALAAGPWAWTKAMPVVLTGQDGLLDEGTLVAIADDAHVRHVIVLGGPSAVADVASQLPAGIACERLGGADRYATAILVADRAAADGLSLTNPYVTSGTGFADALAAGPVAGARGSALLLADPAGTSLASALSGRRDAVRSVTVVGGEAAVSGTAIDALRHTLG